MPVANIFLLSSTHRHPPEEKTPHFLLELSYNLYILQRVSPPPRRYTNTSHTHKFLLKIMSIQTSLPFPLFVANLFLRFLQFIFAIAVLGLYGTDINSARKYGVSPPSKWVYAEVIGVLSALTALVYCLPKINAKAYWACAWDAILLFVFLFFYSFFPLPFLSFFAPFQLMLIRYCTYISILWTAVFGIFGKLFIKLDPKGNGDISRMKNAVWVDLINMLLWLVTAVLGLVLFFKYKGNKSLHTGRATV